MYHLRRLISDREGIDVDQGLRAVKYKLGEDVDSVLDEALQSRCPEDGQSLLMYAVGQGNEAWFLRLVVEIRKQVSVAETS